jgi:hypothetical protein
VNFLPGDLGLPKVFRLGFGEFWGLVREFRGLLGLVMDFRGLLGLVIVARRLPGVPGELGGLLLMSWMTLDAINEAINAVRSRFYNEILKC